MINCTECKYYLSTQDKCIMYNTPIKGYIKECSKKVPIKFCINCEYITIGKFNAKCYTPQNITRNIVTGEEQLGEIQFCENQRMYSRENTCGPEAKWYKEKETKSTETEVDTKKSWLQKLFFN